MRGARAATRAIAVTASALLLATGLTACSKDSSAQLSFCTDPTYPPAEFYQVGKVGSADLKRVLSGADIDIGKAVADKLDKDAKFVTTNFSEIINKLLDKKCDAIISFMNDTAKRRTQVTFVDYLAAGQDLMLKTSTAPISGLAGLFGRSVSVAKSTTEESFLTTANKAAPGGKQITIKSYQTENEAILALHNDKVDAYFGDAPIVKAAVAADSSLVHGPQLVKPIPIGIAMRPGDSRISKVQKAVNDLYTNGEMGRILGRWKFTDYAIKP